MDEKGLKIKNFFGDHWLILAAMIFAILRLPSLFEPFTYGDEGVYLTLGQALRRGLVLYRDIHDNKPPLIYFVAAVAESLAYYRLILFLWGIATIIVFHKLASFIFPKRQQSVIIATLTFTLLTSLHMFEGNIGNAENFMLLPTLGGFWLILKSSKKNTLLWPFLAGVLFSLATLLKVPAISDFFAALSIIFLLNFPLKTQSRLSAMRSLLFAASGFFIPILISFAYYASQNALSQYFSAAFAQNLPYLSSWSGHQPKAAGLPLALIFRGLGLIVVFAIVFLRRKKISQAGKIIIIWFAFSTFAALLSSRPYPHYLIQILPAFSLAFGFWIIPKKRFLPIILTAVVIIIWVFFRFWYYPNLSYLINFYQYALGGKNQEGYFSEFGAQTLNIYKTAKFIQAYVPQGERIFIWGNDPYIYALSRRLPVGRYTVAYHIIDFNGYQETINALRRNPPHYLVLNEGGPPPFPQLADFIARSYSPIVSFGRYRVFLRLIGVS